MNVDKFLQIIGADFYTGVPDSQLKALCDYLIDKYGTDKNHHIIAANEGNSVGIAAGYHLSTGKVPVVYMQNSGEGNAINPITSLINDKVYAIPEIFIIGWRGEPNVHDEPQHIFQGQITLKLLDDLDIDYCILSKDTTEEEVTKQMIKFNHLFEQGKSVAFVVKKGALTYSKKIEYKNNASITREEAIKHIINNCDNDFIVSTTGKASRELFEIREQNKQGHNYDFLTVRSMGHCSSIALGVALNIPNKKIWCIDGDGSILMHMGSLAVIGKIKPNNLIHIVLNNFSHETVGGMPTVSDGINLIEIAKACGYEHTVSVDNCEDLDKELNNIKNINVLSFIEIKCLIGSRKDLGRPTLLPTDNKKQFMQMLKKEKNNA